MPVDRLAVSPEAAAGPIGMTLKGCTAMLAIERDHDSYREIASHKWAPDPQKPPSPARANLNTRGNELMSHVEGVAARTVRALLDRGRSDAPAVGAPGRAAMTFDALRALRDATVGRLNAFGIGRGDRVAIVLPNGPEMATAFVAVACGATTAPLNPAYRDEEFDFYLSDLRAKALVVAARRRGAGGRGRAAARRARSCGCRGQPDRPAGWFELAAEGAARGCAASEPGAPRRTTRRWCCTPRARPRGRRSCRCCSATSRPRRATSAPRWR